MYSKSKINIVDLSKPVGDKGVDDSCLQGWPSSSWGQSPLRLFVFSASGRFSDACNSRWLLVLFVFSARLSGCKWRWRQRRWTDASMVAAMPWNADKPSFYRLKLYSVVEIEMRNRFLGLWDFCRSKISFYDWIVKWVLTHTERVFWLSQKWTFNLRVCLANTKSKMCFDLRGLFGCIFLQKSVLALGVCLAMCFMFKAFLP